MTQNRQLGDLAQLVSVNTAASSIQIGNTSIHSTGITVGNASIHTTGIIVDGQSINNTSFPGTANNTSFVGSVSAANVVSNAQLSANLSNYQTTAGLSSNVATLTANNANFVRANNGITSNSSGVFVTQGTGAVVNATGVHVNATYIGTLTANNASFLGGTAAASYQLNSTLSANVATLTANNTSFVGSVAAVNVVSNAQLSANLANYVTTTNLSSNLSNYQTTAGLNANIASYLPTYTGVVNGASHTVGTSFTANSTVTNTVSLVVSTNTATIGTGTYFVSNGNIGIGTTSPASKLSIGATGVESYDTHFSINCSNTTAGQAMSSVFFGGVLRSRIRTDYVGNMIITPMTGQMFYGYDSPNSTGVIHNFYANNTTQTMIISGAGNVGIGNTTPAEKFVVQSTGGQVATFSNPSSNVNSWIGFNTATGSTTYGIDSDNIAYIYNGFAFKIFTNGANERLRIAANGNVGIGTTSPGYKLDVSGIINTSDQFRASGGGGDVRLNGNYGGTTAVVGTVGSTGFGIMTSNEPSRFWITSGGDIGVNTTSPYGKFTVRPSTNNTSITLSGGDPATGAWIRNDGSNMVISTNVGEMYYGLSGSSKNLYFMPGGSSSGLTIGTDRVVYAPVQFRTPIFYDYDNTGFYVDPASRSRLSSIDYGDSGYYFHAGSWGWRHTTPHGYIEFGPANASHAHIYTDRTNFYFNVDTSANIGYGRDSLRSPIFYDSGNTGYYVDPNGDSNIFGVTLNAKMYFPSGGGGSTFGANHYSMGKDVADGGWSHPHYADLIIGYHTGIRIGASYSGVRFYSNSPTTDANNDGNGDGGETLIMTVGGHVGGGSYVVAHASFRAPIFYDQNDTARYVDPNGTSILNNVQAHDWFRNHGEQGLYSQSYGQHFYPDSGGYWWECDGGIRIREGYEGTVRGHLGYHDGSGFGILNSSGNWQIRMEFGNANMELYNITFANDIRPYIMYDRNDTSYYVDPNSWCRLNAINVNTILSQDNWWLDGGGNARMLWATGSHSYYRTWNWHVFRNSGNADTHYLAGDGNIWTALWGDWVSSQWRSPIFYDYNDTNFYVDPNNTTRINNLTVVGTGSRTLVATVTVSGAATLSYTSLAGYRSYEIEFDNLLPTTQSTTLFMRLHGGGAFLTGAYYNAVASLWNNNSWTGHSSSGSECYLTYPGYFLTTATGGTGMSGTLKLYNTTSTTSNKVYEYNLMGPNYSGGYACWTRGGGWYASSQVAITGFQLYTASGNISGTARIYGYN